MSPKIASGGRRPPFSKNVKPGGGKSVKIFTYIFTKDFFYLEGNELGTG
jgi:hypothetical protein